jgi:hypothetical protein
MIQDTDYPQLFMMDEDCLHSRKSSIVPEVEIFGSESATAQIVGIPPLSVPLQVQLQH